jgi:glycosyltransferase involved in cell wall biosynthesis
MRASVIIPARDAASTLPSTLDGLVGQGAHEVLVVDDGSEDQTRAIARHHPVVTKVVEGPGTGPGAARNAGAAASSGTAALVFLDADCVPVPGWLAAGLRALGEADLVQGRVDPALGVPIGAFDRTLSVTAPWGLFESANLFVRRSVFETLGGFEDWLDGPDETFLGVTVRAKGLAEDVVLGWEVRRSGAVTGFSYEALAHHHVFEREWRAYVAERLRLQWFPAIVRRVPELRGSFLFQGTFLTQRSAEFDLAVLALGAGLAARRPWPLLGAAPYARRALKESSGWAEPRWQVLAVGALADAIGLVSLARGSIAARTPVL